MGNDNSLELKKHPETRLQDVDEDGKPLEIIINVKSGSTTPKKIWESKDEWAPQAAKNRESWEKMSDENREALLRMTRNALARMYDRCEEWIPEGLIMAGGNFVDVDIRFLFTEIEKEIDRNQAATSFQIRDAVKQIEENLAGVERSSS